MMQNGQLYEQVLWEPVIKEVDGGSLPTPTREAAHHRNNVPPSIGKTRGYDLTMKICEQQMLPTPRANQAMAANLNLPSIKNHQYPNLETVISQLPTPTTMDYLPQRSVGSMIKQVTEHRKGRTKLANLREAVNPQAVELFNHLQSLPTPTAREWKDGSSQSTQKCKKQDSLGRAIHHTYPQNGENMYLNPCFVEEMMGYEIGWTDLDH